jgi:hypothetical protein
MMPQELFPFSISRVRGNFARDIPDETSERAVRPTRGASTRRFLSRRSLARKGTKGRFERREEGSLVQTEEPVFAPRTLRAASAPPRDPSPSRTTSLLPPFTFFCLHLFPMLLCSLTSHAALNRRQRASPGRRLLKLLSRNRTACAAAAARED